MKISPGFIQTYFAKFHRDIGIDLGTANTLVYVGGRGIVLREPSVVAVNKDDGKVIKVGAEAKRMLGRTPANIIAVRPLKDGVIADYEQTEEMLRHFIRSVSARSFFRKTVVVGIPSGVTEVEKRAVIEAAKKAGATHAYVIEEPMAAAIGAGLPIAEPSGSIIVDIGGGTTEVAVISYGGIVSSKSVRTAGDELDEAIISYVKRAFNLAIGDRTAETVKIEIGSAFPLEQEMDMVIKGRDLITGLPRSAVITSEEVRTAIAEPVKEIIEAIKLTLEASPPELAADAMEKGIYLAGGGALLRNLDVLIANETLVPVHIANDPLSCVALGTGIIVEEMNTNPVIRKMLERSSSS
ncbi:MAG: rod shape-determining protein [Armatimonadota bacterium]|jgi:rod shape-determining protein MreB